VLGKVPKFVMPSPYATLTRCSFRTIAGSRTSPGHRARRFSAATSSRWSSAIGIALLFSWSRWLEMFVMPLLVSLNMIPKVALGPLIIVWFKYGVGRTCMMAFSICFFPIVLTTARGLREVEPDLLDLVRTLRGSRWQVFTKIQLPGALPYIFSGMKVAAILAVAGAIVGEFLGSDRGLGYLMLQVQVTLDTAAMFMAVLLITLIGMLLYGMVLARARCSSCATRARIAMVAEPFIHLAGVAKSIARGKARTSRSPTHLRRLPGELVCAGRPVRLRQDHAAEDPRRPASARRRRGAHRLAGAAVRSLARHRHGVPAAAAAEMATILDNVLLPAEILGLPIAASRERARDLLALVGLPARRQVSLRALRRHAAARRDRARAGPRSQADPDGRAVRRARCADAREDEPRAAAHLGEAARPSCSSPTASGGGVPRHARRRAHRRPGAHGRQFPRRAAASAHARHEDHENRSANTRALEAAVHESGGDAMLMTEPKRIVVENGRAVGVEIAEGEMIRARHFVVSSLNPTQTFIDLLDEALVPPPSASRSSASSTISSRRYLPCISICASRRAMRRARSGPSLRKPSW
jgi:NitT/TauT family transport system permease protein